MEVGKLWVTLGLDKVGFDKDVNDVKSQAGGLGDFLKSSFQFAVGVGMFDAIKEGIKGVIDVSIGFNSQMQQNQIAFETMLGSAEKATGLMEKLKQMSVSTPFQFKDLADASKRLLAFGFEAQKIPAILKSIGDASSGLGMSGTEGLNRIGLALGQINAKGKLSAQEMMQLTEAGIPAWDMLAKSMGKSTGEIMKMTEKGMIPAKQAIDVLLAGMETRFPNMMDKQSKTFAGLMSTIKDGIEIVGGALTKDLFDNMTVGLQSVADALSGFAEKVSSDGVAGALKSIIPPDVYANMQNFASWIEGTLLPVLEQIGSDALTVAGYVGQLATGGFGVLGQVLESLGTGVLYIIKDIFDWLAQNGPLVQASIVGIATSFLAFQVVAVVNRIVAEFNMGMALVPMATGFVAKLGMAILELRTAPAIIGGVRNAFIILTGVTPELALLAVGIAVIGGLAYEMAKHWQDVPAFFSALWKTIVNVFEIAGNSILHVVQELNVMVAHVLNWLAQKVLECVNGILSALASIPMVGDVFKGASAGVQNFSNMLNGLVGGIDGSLSATEGRISASFDAIGEAWSGSGGKLVNDIASDVTGMISNIKQGVTGGLSGTADEVKKAQDKIKGEFDQQLPSYEDAGKSLGQALTNGIDKGTKGKTNKGKTIDVGQEIKDSFGTALTTMEGSINRLLIPQQKLEDTLENEYKALEITGQKVGVLTDEYNKMVDAKGKNNSETISVLQSLEQEKTAYEQLKQKIADTTKQLQEQNEKQKKAIIDNINNLNTYVMDALKNKYQEEQSLAEASLNAQLKNIDKLKTAQEKAIEDSYNAKIKALDDETKAQTDALQKQLDAIDDAENKRSQDKQNRDDVVQIETINAQLQVTTDPKEQLKLRQDLAKAQADQEDHLRKQGVDAEKKALQSKMDALKNSCDAQKQIWQDARDNEKQAIEDTYNAQKDALNMSLENIRTFYSNKLKQANIEAESEKLLQDKNQKDIITLLNKYGDAYKITGSSLGEKLFYGIKDWTDKIQSIVANIIAQVKSVQLMTGGGSVSGGSTPVKKMHSGGLVGSVPLGNDEVLRVLQDGEFVLPKKAVSSLSRMGTSIAGAGGPSINIDVHDNSFRDGTDAGNKIYEAIRRLGI